MSQLTNSINTHRNHKNHQRPNMRPNPYNPNNVNAALIEEISPKKNAMYVRKQSICSDDEQINRQDQILETARGIYTLFLTTHRLPGIPRARLFKLHKGIRRLCKSKTRITHPEQPSFPSLLLSPKRSLAQQLRSRCQVIDTSLHVW